MELEMRNKILFCDVTKTEPSRGDEFIELMKYSTEMYISDSSR